MKWFALFLGLFVLSSSPANACGTHVCVGVGVAVGEAPATAAKSGAGTAPLLVWPACPSALARIGSDEAGGADWSGALATSDRDLAADLSASEVASSCLGTPEAVPARIHHPARAKMATRRRTFRKVRRFMGRSRGMY